MPAILLIQLMMMFSLNLPVENYKGFYSMDSPDGYGKQDIYQIEIFSDDHPRKFTISGKSSVADLLSIYEDSVKISVIKYQKTRTGHDSLHQPKNQGVCIQSSTG